MPAREGLARQVGAERVSVGRDGVGQRTGELVGEVRSAQQELRWVAVAGRFSRRVDSGIEDGHVGRAILVEVFHQHDRVARLDGQSRRQQPTERRVRLSQQDGERGSLMAVGGVVAVLDPRERHEVVEAISVPVRYRHHAVRARQRVLRLDGREGGVGLPDGATLGRLLDRLGRRGGGGPASCYGDGGQQEGRPENDQRSGCWKSAPDRIRPHTLDPAGIVSYKSVRDILTGEEFVRRVRRLGRERGVAVRFDPRAGKGSHGRLYYGEHFTTIKNRRKEIGAGLLAAMLRQLGLSRDDL